MEIFIADITDFESRQKPCLSCLSEEELEYSKGIYNPKVKNKFITGKALTRNLLSHRLRVPPKQIIFEKNTNGKPYVKGTPIHFSISHSKDVFVIALANSEVGVDVEHMKDRDFMALAQLNFSSEAIEKVLASLNPKEEFYRQWTLYEAAVKLHGSSIFNKDIKTPEYSYTQSGGGYMLTVASNDEFVSKMEMRLL